MRKPIGYDDVQASEAGVYSQLPPGNYVCTILQASEQQSRSGNQMLVLLLDIAEGEHKDYFRTAYNRAKMRNPDAKWGCVYRQLTEGNSTAYFKGMIKAIEESNTGYVWHFDEKTLKDKKIGAMFGREEYIGNDNNMHWSCKPRFVCSVESLADKAILADKKLQSSTSTTNGFIDLDGATEDDLPF